MSQIDADRRRYRLELAELKVVGQSPGKNLRIKVIGERTQYKVKLKPGCLKGMDSRKFLAELNAAHAMAIMLHRAQKGQLKHKHLPH